MTAALSVALGLAGPGTHAAGGVLVLAVRAGEPGAGLHIISGPIPVRRV
jgi:hypothetical protein